MSPGTRLVMGRFSLPFGRSSWFARLSLRLAVALFVLIGCLTIPKIAPRMAQLFQRRDARVQIASRATGQQEVTPEERVRAADVAWIAAAAAAGLLILAPLGYFALRPRTP